MNTAPDPWASVMVTVPTLLADSDICQAQADRPMFCCGAPLLVGLSTASSTLSLPPTLAENSAGTTSKSVVCRSRVSFTVKDPSVAVMLVLPRVLPWLSVT